MLIRWSWLFLFCCASLARGADDEYEQKVLGVGLHDLYVFKHLDSEGVIKDSKKLVILLTFNPYQGILEVDDVLDSGHKYSIFIAYNNDLDNPLKRFDFYLGGPRQYAVVVDNSVDPLIGKIGETVLEEDKFFKAYLGTRADASVIDRDHFNTFREEPCLVKKGLSCRSRSSPVNYSEGRNIGLIAIEMETEWIDEDSEELLGVLGVWAKAYTRN